MKSATIEFGQLDSDDHIITIVTDGRTINEQIVTETEWESFSGSNCERIAAILDWVNTEFNGDVIYCLSDIQNV